MHQIAFLLHSFCPYPIFFHLRIIFLFRFMSTGCSKHASSLLVFRDPSTLLVVHKKPQKFQLLLALQAQATPEAQGRPSEMAAVNKSAQALWERQIPLATTDLSFQGPVLKVGWGFRKTASAVPPRSQFQDTEL